MKMKQILVLCLLLSGCAAHVTHPGTANSFDSDTYDTLLTTDSVIQSTKADLAAGKFSPSLAVTVKKALNDLINVYDIADTFYCGTPVGTPLTCSPNSYHSLAVAGTVTPQQTMQMQVSVTQVNSAVASLTAAKGGI
jgi:hypothetical protein